MELSSIKMEIDQQLNPPVQCRLCGNYGDHRFELFDPSSEEISSSLSEKIFRCLDIEVVSSDPTTVICADCSNKLHGYDQFREVFHATNRKIKNSISRHQNGVGDGVVFKSNVKYEAFVESGVVYVSLVDSDSESNGEADELAISCNLTPKIERLEVVSDAQVNDSAESSVDVFASTSSISVKHECSEISSKLEMTEDEQTIESQTAVSENESATVAYCAEVDISDELIVDSPFAAHESDSHTGTDMDANGVEPAAHVPRKKILRKMRSSMPTATVKMELEVNKKTKKNASKFRIKCSYNGQCPNSFESREAIKLHLQYYHENRSKRTFCCHICKKTIARRAYLERHMNTLHTQAVRFMCPNRDCSKICSTKSNLNKHIHAMHENQGAFSCPKCFKAFFREFLLKKHLAVAHGDGVAFVCDLCKNSFAKKNHLQTHIKFNHTKVTLHKCPEATCSKSFKKKADMGRHIDGVHSQKVHECTKCPAKFAWKQSLHSHSLLKH